MERALETIWREAPFGLAYVNPDGSFKNANPALCDLLGYSELELQTRSFQKITHPEDVEGDVFLATEVREGRRVSYNYIKRYLPKFGDVVWATLRVSGVWDGEKNFVGYIAFVAKLDPRQAPVKIESNGAARPFQWGWLTKYWPQIVVGLGAVAYVVAEAMKAFHKGA